MTLPNKSQKSWGARLEALFPWIVAIPTGLVYWLFPVAVPDHLQGDFIGGSLTTSILLIGFLATSKSILMSQAGSRAFSQLKASGHLRKMNGYINFGMTTAAIHMLASFSLYSGFCAEKLITWATLMPLMVAAFARVMWLQNKMSNEL